MSNFTAGDLRVIELLVSSVMRGAHMSEIASNVAALVEIAAKYCDELHRMEIPGAGWHVKETSAGVFHIVVKGANSERLAFMLSKRNAVAFASAIIQESEK
jgi:hypothetical protein